MDHRDTAAAYQSPGYEGKRFSEYASRGTVSDPLGFLADIDREIRAENASSWRERLKELHAHIVAEHNVSCETPGCREG